MSIYKHLALSPVVSYLYPPNLTLVARAGMFAIEGHLASCAHYLSQPKPSGPGAITVPLPSFDLLLENRRSSAGLPIAACIKLGVALL